MITPCSKGSGECEQDHIVEHIVESSPVRVYVLVLIEVVSFKLSFEFQLLNVVKFGIEKFEIEVTMTKNERSVKLVGGKFRT